MRLRSFGMARLSLIMCLLLSVAGPTALRAQEPGEQSYLVNAQLPWHHAVLDTGGQLLAWFHPGENRGYDQFLRLDWDFLEHHVPLDPRTGVKVYLTAPVFDPETRQGISWQHDPASFYAHLTDLLVGWYPYSGDEEATRVVREMLDYQMAHGTTPAGWAWSGVPFSTSCTGEKEYGRCFEGVPKEFYGGIEPDKVGELGLAYLLFYELTTDRKYLEAGIRCADALAQHVRAGDATHTPWPFRVDAHTGQTLNGDEYGGMIVAPVRLFDELLRLGDGGSAGYRKARDTAWQWILRQPLNRQSAAWDKWSGYYEDVPRDSENENDMTSMLFCYYLLSQDAPQALDPQWKADVAHLLDRSQALLGRGPFFGAWAIDEQLRPDGGITGSASLAAALARLGGSLPGVFGRGCCSRAGMSCRTAQWGAINAMYYERTGDGSARDNAFRSLNYATYFAGSDGRIACCGADYGHSYWFEDGYADAGRSFMWALGAVPDWAPKGEDHLLRSSSVIQKVAYGSEAIEYRTFQAAGTEVFRLTFRPVQVTAGDAVLPLRANPDGASYEVEPLPSGDYVVRIHRANSNRIRIARR